MFTNKLLFGDIIKGTTRYVGYINTYYKQSGQGVRFYPWAPVALRYANSDTLYCGWFINASGDIQDYGEADFTKSELAKSTTMKIYIGDYPELISL